MTTHAIELDAKEQLIILDALNEEYRREAGHGKKCRELAAANGAGITDWRTHAAASDARLAEIEAVVAKLHDAARQWWAQYRADDAEAVPA